MMKASKKKPCGRAGLRRRWQRRFPFSVPPPQGRRGRCGPGREPRERAWCAKEEGAREKELVQMWSE